MSYEISLSELKSIFRRRKNLFLSSFTLIFLVCLIVAFTLPSIYESQVLIIVENQDIPEEYVRSTTTDYISQRLRVLERKILSYQKFLEIIKSQGLYPGLATNGDKVARLRRNITLETVDVTLASRAQSSTIAFTLAYQNQDPVKAKKVADILSNLFVEEDQKSREKRADSTTLFLEKELEELRLLVKNNEEKISAFKAANIDQLPGSTGIFQQTVLRLESDIDDIETRIRTLREKIVYLRSQIANIDKMVPILTESGKVANNPNNRLKYLRLQLIQMQANLSDKHPDIIRLKSEIEKLEAQGGEKDTLVEQANRLKIVQKQIAELSAKYGNKHPDLIKLESEAQLLKRQIAEKRKVEIESDQLDDQSDNPGYMNIKAQIIVANSEIDALIDEREKQRRKLEEYQEKLARAPFIDEEYNSMTLDYENAKKKFDEVASKLHSARIAQELDTSESGERFRIEYPAILPDKPKKPNRLFIILAGVVLGLGCGVTLAAIVEGLDTSVKATEEVEKLAGIPVLATVSFVDSPLHKRQRRSKRLVVLGTVVVTIIIASFAINWFVMPLGDIWAKLEDRLVEIGVPIDKKS